MKKLLNLALSLVFIAFLSACSSEKDQNSTNLSQNSTQNSSISNLQNSQNAENSTNLSQNSANLSPNSTKILRVFATHPQNTALLEIVYPQGMIGLNYKPYPEDTDFMPPNVAQLPVLGAMDRVNFEQLIALKPDVVIFPEFSDPSIAQPYEKLGIKTLRVSAQFKDIKRALNAYGEVLGVNERTDKILAFHSEISAKMDALRARVEKKPRIYFAQGFEGLSSECVSEGDEDDLATMIGGENVIKCEKVVAAKNALPMNFERLIALDPDAIFVREIPLYKELISSPKPEWQRLRAVQQGRIYYAPSSPSNWLTKPPTIMRVIGFPWAFSRLHPELLSPSEAKDIAKAFFAEFLVPISDEDYAKLEGK